MKRVTGRSGARSADGVTLGGTARSKARSKAQGKTQSEGQNGKQGRSGHKSIAKQQSQLHGVKIEDYALIGDCETAALVSRQGSIDWLCWPTFSSPACFAALLGTRDHGFWKIAPRGKVKRSRRQYREGTLIVDTSFETSRGEVCVSDFMPPRRRHSQLVRMVRGVRGSVRMRMCLAIRFDYGRTVPWVTSGDQLRAVAGSEMVVLETDAPLKGENLTTVSEFTVHAGQTVSFTLVYCSSLERMPKKSSPSRALKQTEAFWRRWVKKNCYRGEYAEEVARSLMTLKAMIYRPTGGIVAAATTSLPERIGGERNWDYRYCWLRDTAFTLEALLHAGYREEAVEWRRWLLRAVAGAPSQVQTLYGISGERNLNEWQADWLPGYRNSRPVRIGNGAAGQFQLDVFGEISSALARMPEAEQDIRVPATQVQVALANHLCKVWRLPDAGIWEVRGEEQHFVYSKVMAWVALDQAIEFVEKSSSEERDPREKREWAGHIRRWRRVRSEIHREVCEKGFDRKRNCFVQAYGAGSRPGTLDASCLRIALVGFLPPTDPRVRGTVEAIEKGLMKDGLIRRYDTGQTEDGLTGGEGQFLACSFWMVSNLWLIGRETDARAMFERLLTLANDVGLLAEEYDTRGKHLVGNYPQALSHIALIHAAFTMAGEWTL